jgi:hypothetical protein
VIITLKSRDCPCTGCDDMPGGCKKRHSCPEYKAYEERKHKQSAEHDTAVNGKCAENWARYSAQRKSMQRVAMGHGFRPAIVR